MYFREYEYHNLEAVINIKDDLTYLCGYYIIKVHVIFIIYIFKNTTNASVAFAFIHNWINAKFSIRNEDLKFFPSLWFMHVGFHTLFFFMETRLTIPHLLLVGMQTGTATIENGIEVHQKINKRVNL